MAQLDDMQPNGGTSKTVEQLLHSDSPSAWNMPSTLGRVHDQEEDHFHHSKKISVIAKVREKAKKWRQNLVRKRHGNDSNNTPSWGVALEDYEVEEDPDHLAAPTYESEHAPGLYRKNSRQYVRAKPDSVTSEKRVLGIGLNNHSDNQDRERYPNLKKSMHGPTLAKSYSDHQRGNPSKMTLNETLRAKSFGNYQNEKAPSTSKTTAEALMAYRNVDQHNEKLLHPEMTTETAFAEIEDNEEHPSENEATTQNVIGKNTAYEQKEKLPSPRKIRTPNVNDKSIAYEQKEKLPSPRKTRGPSATGKSIAYEEDNFSSPRMTPTQYIIDTSTAYEQVEMLPSPRITTTQYMMDKSPTYEQEDQRLYSPRKSTTQNTIDKNTSYNQREKFFSPRKPDHETEKPLSLQRMTKTEGAESTDVEEEQEKKSPTTIKTITEAVSEKLAPAYATVSEATQKITSKLQGLSTGLPLQGIGSEERKWDKGVSVKEYLKSKLEPGEDERALSQVISEAISPRKSPTEKGVVEKVKEAAATFLLQTEEPSSSSSASYSIKNSDSSSQIPVSTNANEVEEENQGRILQAN